MFFSKKKPDLSLTLTNPNPDSAPTHMNFVWILFFFAKKIGRPHQKRLLKKIVVDVDKIFFNFRMYVILDNNAVTR